MAVTCDYGGISPRACHGPWVLPYLLCAATLLGCSPLLTDSGSTNSASDSKTSTDLALVSSPSLTLAPSTALLNWGNTGVVRYSATGGSGGSTFQVLSGPGSINSSSGV